MQSFSIRDLCEDIGDISRAAEQGELSLVTCDGHPLFISVPFDERVIESGVYLALAENLFKSGVMSLGKAAKLANLSRVEFGEYLSRLGIAIVDYDSLELDTELEYFTG